MIWEQDTSAYNASYTNIHTHATLPNGAFSDDCLMTISHRNENTSVEECFIYFTWDYKCDWWKQGHCHDDVIKRKHFPRYWPFVSGIHRSSADSPNKDQWRGALLFSLICAWTNGWANYRDDDYLRRHRAHYDGHSYNHRTYEDDQNVKVGLRSQNLCEHTPSYINPVNIRNICKQVYVPLSCSTSQQLSPRSGIRNILLPKWWWHHQMETFSALLALCDGNSPVTCGFPSQTASNAGFDVFFGVSLNKRLNKQTRHRWFETPSRPYPENFPRASIYEHAYCAAQDGLSI